MTRLQKGLLFSLASVLGILITVLVLEVAQPGGYRGLRGLFGSEDVSGPTVVDTPETSLPPLVIATPPPSLPGEVHMPREDAEAESSSPEIPDLVGVVQNESAANIFADSGDVIRFGNFDWRVLERQGSLALVISDDVILWMPYHDSLGEVTWATSSVRNELNTTFFESFHPNDRGRIIGTPVTTSSNPWFGTSGGEATMDKIFLLSIEETVRFFGDSGKLGSKTPPQDWQDPSAWYIDDEFNSNRLSGGVMWWLRSPGFISQRVAAVSTTGLLSVRGDLNPTLPAGVRPAMWVDLGTHVADPSPPVLPTPPDGTLPTPALPLPPDAGILRVGDVIIFGGFEFVVLDVQEREALILSKNIILYNHYHSRREDATWRESTIRDFLNNRFLLENFIQSEINRIVWSNFEKNEIENLDNLWFGTSGGEDGYDLVFLLCIQQVLRYFGDSGFVEAGINPAARNAVWPQFGAYLWGVHDQFSGSIHDDVLNRRMATDRQGDTGRWWLRNPGFYPTDAVFVDADGSLNINGTAVWFQDIGIRPAMWIRF